MIGIKDFGMPSCCMNCEMFDGEYGNCDIIGDTQDFEYQWDENRPFDCPLVEAIPKSDYENRLKADMVAMLEELKEQLREMHEDFFEGERFDEAYGVSDSMDLIEQKIHKLKEIADGKNDG